MNGQVKTDKGIPYTHKQIEKRATDLHKLNSQYRGEIINHAINTETHLEMIISYYFTLGNTQKAKELRHCLLSNNMFSSNTKKNMFLFILKTSFPKSKINSKDIEEIINFRNQMAHGKQVYSSDTLMDELTNFDNDTITLYEWNTKKNSMKTNTITLTRKIIDKKVEHIKSVNIKLIELFKLIKAQYVTK